AVVAAGFVTVTSTGPVRPVAGTCTFNWVELMKEIAAGRPAMATETPSRDVGSLPAMISADVQVRVWGARFVPRIEIQEPSATAERKLALLTTDEMVVAGGWTAMAPSAASNV